MGESRKEEEEEEEEEEEVGNTLYAHRGFEISAPGDASHFSGYWYTRPHTVVIIRTRRQLAVESTLNIQVTH
ncbi:hypothetical protein E2C01_026853 [Portunus trituberculatus]|uniref:Uncharacterized protein n=1 Tax=Portunus trituberculatus TaxID=210409 RepID=A0A5B7EGM1_PORTR|nr:hypothetical protein [Portunus trituberculatus]